MEEFKLYSGKWSIPSLKTVITRSELEFWMDTSFYPIDKIS